MAANAALNDFWFLQL